MLKITKTYIKDLLIIDGKQHDDNRGYLRELTSEKEIGNKFKFTIVSKSKKNVLRGLHFQTKKPQGKYVTILKGKILDVVVDLRKKSKTFGKSFSVILSEKNCRGLYIPPGFAHGFQTLEGDTEILYLHNKNFNKKIYRTINPLDIKLNIKWPIKKKIISKKDLNKKYL